MFLPSLYVIFNIVLLYILKIFSKNYSDLMNSPFSKSIRIFDPHLEERELIKITDILGREVNPDKVIDKTTLFYIYSDGSVEKRIKIK